MAYENVERVAGEIKWSFWKLFKYAIDGIINFSQAPISIASSFGIFMTLCSFIMLFVIIIRKLMFGDPVTGWASTICVIIFIGGDSAVLSWNHRAVYRKNIYGDEKLTAFYYCRYE